MVNAMINNVLNDDNAIAKLFRTTTNEINNYYRVLTRVDKTLFDLNAAYVDIVENNQNNQSDAPWPEVKALYLRSFLSNDQNRVLEMIQEKEEAITLLTDHLVLKLLKELEIACRQEIMLNELSVFEDYYYLGSKLETKRLAGKLHNFIWRYSRGRRNGKQVQRYVHRLLNDFRGKYGKVVTINARKVNEIMDEVTIQAHDNVLRIRNGEEPILRRRRRTTTSGQRLVVVNQAIDFN